MLQFSRSIYMLFGSLITTLKKHFPRIDSDYLKVDVVSLWEEMRSEVTSESTTECDHF